MTHHVDTSQATPHLPFQPSPPQVNSRLLFPSRSFARISAEPCQQRALQSNLRLLTRVILVCLLIVASSVSLFSKACSAEFHSAPNVVLILADDLGYGDLRCYDKQSKIPTVEIDQLAARGMRFTDAHSPSSVCSPTRYGLLTGRYAWRSALKSRVLWAFDPPLIEEGRATIATLLKKHRYATGCIGKWHLGWEWKNADGKPIELPYPIGVGGNQVRLKPAQAIDYSQQLGGGPLAVGFDTYFGDDVINQPPFLWIENNRCLTRPTLGSNPNLLRGSADGPTTPGWDQKAVLPKMKERTVGYIRERRKKPEEPFLLYLPLTAPHVPIVPPERFKGTSQFGEYGDFVMQVDDFVGEVVDAIAAAGMTEKTIVIFTSDNGSYMRPSDGHRPNGPWRDRKASIYEGGHRIPLIVTWPGQVEAGTTNHQLVGLNDIPATLAEIVGSTFPEAAAEDSVSLLNTLRDPKKSVRESLIHHSGNGQFAIREGDWKLILHHKDEGDQKSDELYHIIDDPAEQKNLVAEKPVVVQRLRNSLARIRGED